MDGISIVLVPHLIEVVEGLENEVEVCSSQGSERLERADGYIDPGFSLTRRRTSLLRSR